MRIYVSSNDAHETHFHWHGLIKLYTMYGKNFTAKFWANVDFLHLFYGSQHELGREEDFTM